MSAPGPAQSGASQSVVEPHLPPVWPLLRAMVSVGLLCGLLIAGAFLVTRPVIERNLAEAMQRAIFEVLSNAETTRSFRWQPDGGFLPAEDGGGADGPLVHVGYDAGGALVGIAIEAAGMGYQDVIRILYGYSPAESAVVGMQVLESRETPGLGDRIETDEAFRANFEALDVRLDAAAEAIANPIVAVKSGEKTSPWEIDGITGATISAEAIAGILRKSTALWIPRIQGALDDLGEGA